MGRGAPQPEPASGGVHGGGQVVPDALEVAIVRGPVGRAGHGRVAAVVALDERDERSDECCEEDDVHGRNYVPITIPPRVAELPTYVNFLP